MTAPTLTEFLLARIAEDEEWAWHPDWCASVADDQACDCNGAARIAAECEAKRRIVEMYLSREAQAHEHNAVAAHATGLLLALRALALPYADHEDFQEEWRV